MADETLFEQNLNNPDNPVIAEQAFSAEQGISGQADINEINEDEYLKVVRTKNRKTLIKLDYLERERLGRYIKSLYDDVKTEHKDICDRLDKYDDVFRMRRATQPGDDENTPNYRTPLSTVTLEVIHANIMNVFFTPKDILRVIPTEENDIPKVKKLDTFGNWSMQNELDIFSNADRVFHSSGKNGECPYIVHWVKEYGTELKIEPVMNPAQPDEPLIDEVTKEPITQEREITKLLYNGPRLEPFSRKDYILPKNAVADKQPVWEMRRVRFTADKVNTYEREGRFYAGVFEEIGGWGVEGIGFENELKDVQGDEVPLGKTEKIFVEFYGRLRIQAIKTDEQGEEQYEEMEDEYIGIIELVSETLCSLRKNRFPFKMRPIGLDMFIPDDEGRKRGTGVIEFMDSIQKSYDALHNQYLFGTIQANDPFGFYTPTGNMRDVPMKTKTGYLYPTTDPKSVNIVKLPPPDDSLRVMMEEVRNQSQLLFGVSDYQAGMESQIDPSAPAKKAEIVLAQGNVRLNLIIKRKNKTLKDIFKRWYLLYQANMPPNKFMRIVGADRDNPDWTFEKVNLSDFALKSIPDFELTGNVLNSNKTLEVNKALAIYNVLAPNPFFALTSQQGGQALHALTKWLMDKLDETGISNFLPAVPAENVITPEEENARFLQGDTGEPKEGEDHVKHIQTHTQMILDPSTPDDIKKVMIQHNAKHADLLKKQVTQQIVMSQARMRGGMGGQAGGAAPQAGAGRVLPEVGRVGSPESGVTAGV